MNIPAPEIIRAEGIFYSYSKGMAILNDLNMSVHKGSIYGFIGPNGSGKTTTISLLLGILKIKQGKIEIFQKELATNREKILSKIGSLVGDPSLYHHLTARQNLEVYREFYNVSKERVQKVLHILDLNSTDKKLVKEFSLGMKQRLGIALALLSNPELLILDEPGNGLDPSGMIELRKLLKKINEEEGTTILLSSHLLSEVEKIATHVGIISKGILVFEGSLTELKQIQKNQLQLEIETSNDREARKVLKDYIIESRPSGFSIILDHKEEIAEINTLLSHNGLKIYQLQPKECNLEDLFINLTTSKS